MCADQQLHPILLQMDPSPEQVLPILLRGQDIAVSAGAGTGKTRTLVARVLSLLAEGVPLRAIVAITFTKKAAREMRNRIREEIRKYLSGLGSGPEREKWALLYEDLDAARISTIHSLAADILRQHPAEAGLDPRFELLDENHSARLLSQAGEAALAWAGDDPEASALFTEIGAWQLRRLLGELLGKRLEIGEYYANFPPDLWAIWQPQLVEPIQRFIEKPDVQEALDQLLELKLQGVLDRAEQAGDSLVPDLRIVIENWEGIKTALEETDWAAVTRRVGRLGKHLKQKGKAANWAPAKPKEAIKYLQTEFGKEFSTPELSLEMDQRLARLVIPQLGRLFRYANDWYGSAKSHERALDFDDLEHLVLELFGGHANVLQYWQEQVQHVLVDEYQDTNERQRQLVNLLSGDQGRLFIVGDGKQSIYRFRGADVSVFRQEQQRIRNGGTFCQLATSYRAHADLLQGLNEMLAPVLGESDDLPFREPFSALQPGRAEPPAAQLPGYVEVHLAGGTKSGGAAALAAQAVAARLKSLIEKEQERPASGLGYGDAAVLCRASSSFPDFESAFQEAGIPYFTIAGQGFYERPEIRELLNALRVFADPWDDLAAAGLLRSAAFAIGDDTLLAVRDFQQEQGIASLYQAVQAFGASAQAATRERLDFFLSVVEEFSTLAGRIPAGALIAQYLNRTNLIPALLSAGQLRGAKNLRKLVADAQTSGIVGLQAFLVGLEELRSVSAREGEAPSVPEGAVQIMTVHQAKGLEFPVVVLGDAAKRDPASRNILLDERFGLVLPFSKKIILDEDGEIEVISAASLAYQMAKEQEDLQEDAESDRLLYVAATRAKDLLIVSGVIGNPTRGNTLPQLGGWLGKLSGPLGLADREISLMLDGDQVHCLNADRRNGPGIWLYEPGVQFDFVLPDRVPTVKLPEPGCIPAFQGWSPEISRAAAFDLAANPIFRASSRAEDKRIPARVVGEVVHRALGQWKFPSAGEAQFGEWIEREFHREGYFTAPNLADGIARARKMLNRFQDSSLFERMQEAVLLRHEVHYSWIDPRGNYQQGSIDALFQEDQAWVLVEFKTDQIKDALAYDRIWEEKDYQQQVAGYLEAAEGLLGQRPEPVLCFLDYQGRLFLETTRWGG